MNRVIDDNLNEHMNLLEKMRKSEYPTQVECIANLLIKTLQSGNKILIAGNGGSAADAQHFAAEMVGKFEKERMGLPVIALTTDTSILTSIGNDCGYEYIFERQIEAIGNKNDVFVGISTSGNSENILRAMKEARKKGMITIGLLGRDGGEIANECDYMICVNYGRTARIQELHEITIHILCQLIDENID